MSSNFIKWSWNKDEGKCSFAEAALAFAHDSGYTNEGSAKLMVMPSSDTVDEPASGVTDAEQVDLSDGEYIIASAHPFRTHSMFFAQSTNLLTFSQ